MTLSLELKLAIVAIGPNGVTIQPEYWWDGQRIDQHQVRTVQAGESILFGPFTADVSFHPPIIPVGTTKE